MLMSVENFRRRTEYELDGLVGDLRDTTGRNSPAELRAWRNSLPALSRVLASEHLQGFHIHLGTRGDMLVEYRLPASPSWADVVLLGAGADGPSAVVVELKDWDTGGDAPSEAGAYVVRSRAHELHPSAQVEGYVEYCRKFHSAVQARKATVHGCVYFTFSSAADIYCGEPYTDLVGRFPVFARNAEDVERRCPDFLSRHLRTPDRGFAEAFEAGVYHQDRGFVRQVSESIRRSTSTPFVLLDAQRLGFEECRARIEGMMRPARARARPHEDKSVVVVHGPPGSGKSIIAAQLWATYGGDPRLDGNIVLTTTSSAQRSNWESLFEHVTGERGARGVVLGANRYNPGFNQRWLKEARGAGHEVTVESWRRNLELFRASGARTRCPDNSIAVSIVDEAHALIDPTVPDKKGISSAGWMLHAGPQAWHIIRASRVSVFLMDPEQSYRDNETTTITRIREFAEEQGADYCAVSLAGSQFRCGGSREYVEWLETAMLAPTRSASVEGHRHLLRWSARHGGPLSFDVAESPAELEARLRARLAEGRSCRLVASYARPWVSGKVRDPHGLEPHRRDIVITTREGGCERVWAKVWNHAPAGDYSLFIQGHAGSAIGGDPLSEVGCPYVVRGFDFDYVGLLWLSDLVWRTDRWRVNLDQVHESALRLTCSRARRGVSGAREAVMRQLLRGYRILLSRAMRGNVVWFEDAETREHVEGLLGMASRGR
jgi:hypothetical protein